jgi:signal transduction histidine kinase
MMVAGLVVVLSSLEDLQAMGVLALALIVAIGGFLIVAGPWLWSLIEDLRTERRARIRSEEKAEMAAHLHDSVLQTLALIQRTDDPKRMVTLARSQERELRSWLFDESAGDVQTLKGALADAASRVEEAHDVPVSVVVVGESELPTDRHTALVGAATEAMMNAAKHSGADRVSVFAEATNGVVEVFITDQGTGFNPDDVDTDRRGVAESITGRMQRHGGSAMIDSEPGVGTEVHLTMTGGSG